MTDLRKMSLFRDVQVALDFQQMAAEGYVDTEFTMYGTAYYQDGQRHYIISSDETRVIDFIESSEARDLLTMPIESLTEVCHVPLGEKERIAHDVKIRLAHRLQLCYPLEFFECLDSLNRSENNDLAQPILEKMCKKIANTFSEEKLTIVEDLMRNAYKRKVLTKQSYEAFEQWFERERENLEEDIIPKDILSKTWYTVSYEDRPEHIKQLVNARKEWVYQKRARLEKEGKIVAPIYQQTYWYNNQTAMQDTQEKHKEHSKALLDNDYMRAVKEIAMLPAAVDKKAFEAAVAECEKNYSNTALEALQYYGRLWSVSN